MSVAVEHSVTCTCTKVSPKSRSPQIVFVCEIVSVSEFKANVVYKVDDRTGPLVEVKKWLDGQEPSVS